LWLIRARAARCYEWQSVVMTKTSFLALMLGLLTAISALVLAYVQYENRRTFAEWQRQIAVRDELNIEWGRLQIEEGTLATHSRMEQAAVQQLGMVLPSFDAVVFVKQ
jgi:cell division protein FtsL